MFASASSAAPSNLPFLVAVAIVRPSTIITTVLASAHRQLGATIPLIPKPAADDRIPQIEIGICIINHYFQ